MIPYEMWGILYLKYVWGPIELNFEKTMPQLSVARLCYYTKLRKCVAAGFLRSPGTAYMRHQSTKMKNGYNGSRERVKILNFVCILTLFFAEWLVDDCRLLCVWDGGWVPSVQLRPSQGEGATGLHGWRPRPRGDALPLQLPGPCRWRRASQVSSQQR